MQEKNINNILKEVYLLDPSLKEHEDMLMRIISDILKAKPDTQFDKEWAQSLRKQILAQQPTSVSFFERVQHSMKQFQSIYTYGGAVAVVAIIAVLGVMATQQYSPTTTSLTQNTQVQSVSANAFGSLIAQDGKGVALESSTEEMVMADTASDDADAKVAAPTQNLAVATQPAVGFGGGGGGVSEMLIYPNPYTYTYTYTGDDVSLVDEQLTVYRRNTKNSGSGSLAQQVQSLNLGFANLKTFSATDIQNISFVEDKDFGYSVNLNFTDGSMSISENYQRWSYPARDCRDQACFDRYRVSIGDIPDDATIIRMAQSFLDERGIATDTYGEPEVINDWRRGYELAANKADYYIPETLQVRYPFMVNGEIVYEQSGNTAGMMVNVNIQLNRVSGVWNLRAQVYDASAYTAVTDFDRVKKIAERGGIYGPIYAYREDGRSTQETLNLGTPDQILMQTWNYQNGQQNELLVPALRFPVLNQPSDRYFSRDAVVVPLAEELIQQYEQQEQPNVPLPLEEPTIDPAVLQSSQITNTREIEE